MYSKLLRDMQAYLERYVAFQNVDYSFAAALWACGTHLFPRPKQDVEGNLCARARNYTGAKEANIYRAIRNDCPTMINDEAELLAGEGQNVLTAVLNAGYRRGQTVPRSRGEDIIEAPVLSQ